MPTFKPPAVLFLAAILLYFAGFVFKGALVDPPPVPTRVAPDAFDTERAVARLARILGDQRPHPVDSGANDAVRERLLAEIRALGYAPEIRDDFACSGRARWGAVACARVRNVLFRTGPEGGDAVLVASHYDSVGAGPGAGDDGIGVASALEIAALLKGRALKRPVIFLFTDGEEAGLLGAASFVRKDPYAKDVAAVVNLEARGVSGKALMFETASPNGRSVDAFARVSAPAANSLATAIYKMMPNDTDMTEFLALQPDALNFAITRRVAFYHTPHDNLAN
ncbi:MAG: M28 family peptidase, partial [Parvularculaceae bacterium]|nr:M28 family peptidase [Parvularculaceae bacterium]